MLIDVFGMFMTYEKSLDYLGIHSDGVGSTELAGFSAVRPLAPEFGQILQRNVENTYGNFISIVANARDMSVEAVDDVAQGRVWIGTDALQLGLVDELGTLDNAVAAAAEMAELEQYDTVYVKRSLSAQELFWKEFFGQAMTIVGKWQFSSADSALVNEFKRVLKEFSLINKLNDPQGTYVLCLPCDVR